MFHLRLRLLAFSTLTAATALTGVAFALPAHAAATPQYTLKIIGGQGTQVFGINKNGAIFGIADESGAVTQEGFLLQAGSTTMQFLGAPGDQANANSLVSPGGINAAADVVGFTESDKTGTITAAEWPDSSTPTNLGSLAGVQNLVTAPEATAINDNGLITGFGPDGHGEAGFTIQGSTVTRLPAPAQRRRRRHTGSGQQLGPGRRQGRQLDHRHAGRRVEQRRDHGARRAAGQH